MLYCTEYVKSHAARNDTVEQSIDDYPTVNTKFIQYMTLASADDIPAAIAAGFCKKRLAKAATRVRRFWVCSLAACAVVDVCKVRVVFIVASVN